MDYASSPCLKYHQVIEKFPRNILYSKAHILSSLFDTLLNKDVASGGGGSQSKYCFILLG